MGECAGDATRLLTGTSSPTGFVSNRGDGTDIMQGCLVFTGGYKQTDTRDGTGHWLKSIGIDSSRVMPIAQVNRVKSFGVIPCCYLGIPK